MYEDDYLLRHIHSLVELVIAIVRGERPQESVDTYLQSAFGLSLRTIDALGAEALVGMVPAEDHRGRDRLAGLADVLDALAEQAEAQGEGEGVASMRRNKAARIRALITRPAGEEEAG